MGFVARPGKSVSTTGRVLCQDFFMVNLVFLNTLLFDLSVADSNFGVATAMPRFAPSDLCEKPKQCEKRRPRSVVAIHNHGSDFRKAIQISEYRAGLSTDYTDGQAGTTEANLLARTRLRAPRRRVSSPRVEANTGAKGKPLQIVLAARVLRSSPVINGHARAMSPARITASGLNPFVRFAIPSPR